MIKLEKVNKYFNRRRKNEIHIINNTSLELESKGLVAILGQSGSGKTTLLNAIGGLDKVNKGIYIGVGGSFDVMSGTKNGLQKYLLN